ncbi:MAG: LamG-like jellyroll fold domain-containing protein [Planctomycetota bacterium]|jgi:hypothetical protein
MDLSLPRVLLAPALLTFAAPTTLAQTGHYLSLDGQSGQLFVSNVAGLDGLNTFTLEGWVRSTGGNFADKILEIGTDPSYRLTFQASCGSPGTFVINTEKTGAGQASAEVATSVLCDGAWHHVAGTDDGSTLRVYIDGAEVSSAGAAGLTWDMNGRELRLGCHIVGWTDFWEGDLDEFRVWRRALGPAEVAECANWMLPADTTGLVSSYSFENGAADDLSVNNGVLVGGAAIVATPSFVDCNGNGVQDSQDIAAGLSADCNGDGVPDECQLDLWAFEDFENGLPAGMTATGIATALNGAVRLNGVPSPPAPTTDIGRIQFDAPLVLDPADQTGLEWSYRFRITGSYDIMDSRLVSPEWGTEADGFNVVLEIDHYYNWEQSSNEEPNGNHLSIRVQSKIGGQLLDVFPAHYTPSFTLSSGEWHTIRHRLRAGELSVWIAPEGGVEEQVFDEVTLPGIFASDVALSFGAWNGSGTQVCEHWVDDIQVLTSSCDRFTVSNALPRASWSPDDLFVLGAGFDGTETVTVDGQHATVTSWTTTRLRVAWPPSVPGTANLVVTQGTSAVQAPLALLPTLDVTSTGLGGQATADLTFTGSGLGILAFSGQSAPAAPLGTSWHGLELDPLGLQILGVAAIWPLDAVQWVLPIPEDPTLSGLSVAVQAWAQEGFTQGPVSSFSNRVTLNL